MLDRPRTVYTVEGGYCKESVQSSQLSIYGVPVLELRVYVEWHWVRVILSFLRSWEE